MDVFVIIATLLALMYFAYRGVTVLVLAPLLGMAAVLLTGEGMPLEALSDTFMPALSKYIMQYFPVFIAGAIFGKLMGASGAARAISHFIIEKLGTRNALLAIVLATAVLTYGGVSLFVVVFAMYPIGATIMREADIPKRLLPAALTLGAFTFTMSGLPGSPQYLNTMPTIPFGTTIYAAPVLGIFASLMILVLGMVWLRFRSSRAKAAGEGYGDHTDEGLTLTGDQPPVFMAFVPVFIVFVVNYLMTNVYFTMESVASQYQQINGTWPVIIGLGMAIIFILLVFRKYIASANAEVFEGARGSLLPIFNTGSEVGYGAIITSLAAFALVKAGIAGLDIPELAKVAVSSSTLAGVVGSSSGGTAMVLEMLGPEFLATGIDPQVLHRIVLLAAGGLDTLPHCGAVITLLAVCNLTHRQSYGDIAMITMGIPLLTVAATIGLHLITGLV
jgi:H+/gluconate symporter-like permease